MDNNHLVNEGSLIKGSSSNIESNGANIRLSKPAHLLDLEKSLDLDIVLRQMQTLVSDFG